MRKQMTWHQFEVFAQQKMSKHFGVSLVKKSPSGFPKKFDLVSPDESLVGDAKYLTLVHQQYEPPAKFMEIAGHVWLLEKVPAKRRFLVFGNQVEVATRWLEKYGGIPTPVEFYFLPADGQVRRLK